jgi:alanine racemase
MSETLSWAGIDAILEIDVDRIIENYALCGRTAAGAGCAAVVKADCYGLGTSEIAPALFSAGCREFFVATLAEGRRLRRQLGDQCTIYVLNGIHAPALAGAIDFDLVPVLNTPEACRQWARLGRRPAVLQIDTGMSRLGLSLDELAELTADRALIGALDLRLVISHLANADVSKELSEKQRTVFEKALTMLPAIPASLANSAGIFLSPDLHYDLVRPGAALYGIETGPHVAGISAVVALRARVIQIRQVPPGASVGYGFAFTASAPTRLATIGLGYADGWRRDLEARGAAWLDDERLPMVGRVSMDSFVVDISALKKASLREGDFVELIGPHQSVDDIARMAGTIGYEILTGLGSRCHRVYLSGSEDSA